MLSVSLCVRIVFPDPPRKIILAGAFGSHIDKNDLLTLGMLSAIHPDYIWTAGNAAGAGAIMALCDEHYFHQAEQIAEQTFVITMASTFEFQNHFITRLSF